MFFSPVTVFNLKYLGGPVALPSRYSRTAGRNSTIRQRNFLLPRFSTPNKIEGEAPVEGPWVDRVNGLEGVQVDIVIMRTPDGHGRLELTKFRNPKLVEIEPAIAPPNTLGLRSVMFTVESVDDTVARLRANGAELVGEVAQYEDKYRLCYMARPGGHHRRAGRGTLLKRSPPSEKPVAPQALLRLDPMTRNHPAFSPTCAAVLLGALSGPKSTY